MITTTKKNLKKAETEAAAVSAVSDPKSVRAAMVELSIALKERYPTAWVLKMINRLANAKIAKYSSTGVLLEERWNVPAIIAALKFRLEYGEGLPIKRQVRITARLAPSESLQERANRSPQMLKAIMYAAEEAKRLGNAPTIDVEAFKSPSSMEIAEGGHEPLREPVSGSKDEAAHQAMQYLNDQGDKSCQSDSPSVEEIRALIHRLKEQGDA